jgi:hypothetical protein
MVAYYVELEQARQTVLSLCTNTHYTMLSSVKQPINYLLKVALHRLLKCMVSHFKDALMKCVGIYVSLFVRERSMLRQASAPTVSIQHDHPDVTRVYCI